MHRFYCDRWWSRSRDIISACYADGQEHVKPNSFAKEPEWMQGCHKHLMTWGQNVAHAVSSCPDASPHVDNVIQIRVKHND